MINISPANAKIDQSKFLSRIARADKTAVRECIDYYGAMVWALATQSIKTTETAEKAVQEIFLDIWQNAQFYDFTASDEKIWIAMIAHRRLEKYTV